MDRCGVLIKLILVSFALMCSAVVAAEVDLSLTAAPAPAAPAAPAAPPVFLGPGGDVAEADVQAVGSNLQYTGLVLGGDGANANAPHVFTKVQNNGGPVGQFNHAACYLGNGSGGQFGLGFFSLTENFNNAHMKAERAGDTVTISFTNVDGGAKVDQVYVCNGAPPKVGDFIGVNGFANIAELDNFGDGNGVCDDFSYSGTLASSGNWLDAAPGMNADGSVAKGGSRALSFNINCDSIVYSAPIDPIADGSFEDPAICPLADGFETYPTDGALTYWSLDSGTIDHICETWDPADGLQSLDMSGNLGPGGVISQTLTSLDDGHTYKVTFKMAGNPAGLPNVKTLDVAVDGGQSASFNFDVTTDCGGPCDYPTPMGWTEKEYVFVADAASMPLTFSTPDDTGYGPALDEVALFFGNYAPVADDDTYGAVENTQLVVAAPGVLTNDTDADGDPLTAAAGGTAPSNGTLDELLADGSFKYTPNDDYCGSDSFTYYVNDGYTDSSEATVTINIACRPDITSVDPNAQTVDYSDAIATVTIVAEDDDSHPLTLSTVSPLPAFLEITGGCTARGAAPADGTDCEWYLDSKAPDHVNVDAEIFDIEFVATDPETNTNTCSDETDCAHELTVEAEDADVTLDPNNTIDLNDGEIEADLFTLKFQAVELVPDNAVSGGAYPGDLNNMLPKMTLSPVGPGGNVYGTCDFVAPLPDANDGYLQVAYFECEFSNVPVNTYEIVAEVDNGYYYGMDEGVLVVYDPALGFTTGGGFFYWPDTDVPECLEFDTEEPFDCLEYNPDPCAGWVGDKTNFGFNFKYKKKQTNIQGSLLMMRHTCDGGNWKVKSNAIDGMSIGSANDADGDYGWTAVSGKATFRDPTEENSGGNAFLLYVEDHGDQGCNQDPSDEFWIEVAADNVWPDPLGPDPATDDEAVDGDDVPIFCGNIVVPHAAPGKGKK
jgi:choice-of-anchor C domain-containing protein